MKKVIIGSLMVVAVLGFMVSQATAGKPSKDSDGVFNGNGYPSGEHFNLNLIAKPDHFQCPGQEYLCPDGEDVVTDCDDCLTEGTCTPIYGKVIFIPREQDGDDITILMESGRKGPKGKPDATTLEVIDWCTESFPDDGSTPPPSGDKAVLRLPADPDGYAVYARITGKPGENEDDHTINITPSLSYVEDEAGNDFILLGFVRGAKVFNTEGVELPLRRTDGSKSGKGVRKATNITGLFEWTGGVCYIQDDAADLYCWDDGTYVCTTESFCCVDMDYSADGVYEHCDPLSEVGINDQCPEEYCVEVDECYPYESVEALCREYTNHWVFNIADFVGYLWDIDTSGAYVVQIRFYPLPLNTE